MRPHPKDALQSCKGEEQARERRVVLPYGIARNPKNNHFSRKSCLGALINMLNGHYKLFERLPVLYGDYIGTNMGKTQSRIEHFD